MKDRRERIVAALAERVFISTDDLVTLLDSSLTTVRRDLAALAAEGRIRRTAGGAVAMLRGEAEPGPQGSVLSNGDVLESEQEWVPVPRHDPNAAVKRLIGRAAASMVSDHETIALNGGTTGLEVARQLGHHRIAAVTCSLPIALELASRPTVEVLLLGGVLNGVTQEVTGPVTEENVSRLHISTVFLSVAGIDAEHGPTMVSHVEARVACAMAARARRVVVVADHRKIGNVALERTIPIEDVSTLITDNRPTPALDAIRRAGVEVVEVG